MKAFSQKLAIAVAGLLLAAGPALAQRPDSGGGPGAGGDRGGSAGSSSSSSGGGGGGGGGNIAGGGGGGGSVGGGGGGFSSPSISSVSSPSISMGDRAVRSSAPEHRLNYASARSHTASSGDQARPRSSASGAGGSASGSSASGDSSGSSRSGERAAPRSESSAGERAVVRGTDNAAIGSTGRRAGEASGNNASGAREVPNWSRPRGDRPATDVAVPREGPRPPRDSGERNRDRYGYGYPSYGYYDPYYYGGFGYGFGGSYNCGFYGYCNPGFYGYPFYSPYGFGYGIPSGYFDPYAADPYDYGAGYGAYSSRVYGGQDQGNLKLKVKPRNAKVYVDGFYVGLVDEFDGAFQKLTLNGGRHKVELRAEGYETTEFDVLISPEQTVTFAGEMKKVQ